MPVIYKITSPSGRIYIGQSWDWVKRKSVYKRIACPRQKYLYNSLLKYGYDNHKIEIIITLPDEITQEELDNQETKYYNLYKEQGIKLLNIREPGRGGKLSKETKDKMSVSLKGRVIKRESIEKMLATRKRLGTTLSEDARRRIGEKHKGKIISLEMREKIRQKLTGRKRSRDIVEKVRKANTGKHRSEESKKKMSIAAMGRPGRKGAMNHLSKKVIDTETLQIFDSITDAANFYNVKNYNLQNKLSGKVKNKTSLKLFIEWKLIEEVSQK